MFSDPRDRKRSTQEDEEGNITFESNTAKFRRVDESESEIGAQESGQ
jgi:hypothetical protein